MVTKRGKREAIQSLITIHDVTQEVLEQTARLLELIFSEGDGPVILLVVPGGFSDPGAVAELRALLGQNVQLAGHGYSHRAHGRKNLYHQLHSQFISRQAAEHLSRPAEAIENLINNCASWFQEQHVPRPELYVPPAWAMGAISRQQLAQTPFRFFETQGGLLDSHQQHFYRLPLLGYEADTPLRRQLLCAWNRLNRRWAETSGRLRIAIHPHDLDYHLAAELRRDLVRYAERSDCHQLLGGCASSG
jgi:predicted deacetylase